MERIVIVDSLAAPPGTYQLVLRLIDGKTGNHGIVTADIDVPAFAGDGIRLSDPVPAKAVVRDFPEEGAFWRRGHRIVPCPPHTVAAGDALAFYFEIYNIQPGGDGRSYFEVSYGMAGEPPSPFARRDREPGSVDWPIDSDGAIGMGAATLVVRACLPGHR